ncbi:DUF6175 family protein [Bizionia arctica]|uniref:Uncharacterized protein n=1 Tax=Bizionia arctica TaxID=1495645 RepID=A0A917GN86_9FLAO|nr:DUF6175 family protein [Bizionia arctica]GGG52371.1 hypothetical protein GCM10010976_24400 [Bizionia arctica]
MKKLLLIAIIISVTNVFSQAKKPTIMVVPSDDWCTQANFMKSYENQGEIINLPDYNKALQENSDLVSVISKIGELMADRGFPLVDLKSQLDKIAKDGARTNMIGVNESPIDILNKTAKSDIIMKVFWKVNTQGPKKSIEFRMQGIDAYTGKQVAAASGTGPQSFSAEQSVLLEEAVLSELDNFNSQLQTHFDDLLSSGREGALVLLVGEMSETNFNTLYTLKGKEASLKDIVNRFWMPRNTVERRFSMDENSENVLKFSQVRIPLYGDDGWGGQMAYDYATWGGNLQEFLKTELGIETTIQTKGLGEVEIILQ